MTDELKVAGHGTSVVTRARYELVGLADKAIIQQASVEDRLETARAEVLTLERLLKDKRERREALVSALCLVMEGRAQLICEGGSSAEERWCVIMLNYGTAHARGWSRRDGDPDWSQRVIAFTFHAPIITAAPVTDSELSERIARAVKKSSAGFSG